MSDPLPTVAIFGASGLIGSSIAISLRREGIRVVPIARRFTKSQLAAFGEAAVTSDFAEMPSDALAGLLVGADIMVNCVGILQDGRQGDTGTIHHDFVNRLIGVQSHLPNCPLLVHVSIPGQESDDATAFSRTKREAKKILSDNPNPYVVLRPGFVIADAAFGGSALVRALAASPFGVPAAAENRPFAITDVEDIAATVSVLCNQWREGTRDWSAMWDVMARETTSFGQVVDAFRERLGVPTPRFRSPPWMLRLGALCGDAAAALGWAPPIRSTSLKEMQRGVEGAPEDWIAATGVTPSSLSEALGKRPASIQEKWFSRLYLLKGLIVPFWQFSGRSPV